MTKDKSQQIAKLSLNQALSVAGDIINRSAYFYVMDNGNFFVKKEVPEQYLEEWTAICDDHVKRVQALAERVIKDSLQ